MRNLVLHDIAHEKTRQVDAYHRIDQIEEVEGSHVEPLCEEHLNLADKPVQREGGYRGQKTHKETQDKHKMLIRNMFLSPFDQFFLHWNPNKILHESPASRQDRFLP